MNRILASAIFALFVIASGSATCTTSSLAGDKTAHSSTQPASRSKSRPTTLPAAPVADRHPFTSTEFGQAREDDYHWLREKDSPAVLSYIEKENTYTRTVLAPIKKLRAKLLDEFENHAAPNGDSVPSARDDGWLYYESTDDDTDYSRYLRKRADAGAKPQLLVDLNEIAKSQQYVELGDLDPSDNGKMLAYTIDSTGYRQFKLSVKDLETGRLLPDTADRVTSVCWANDGQTLFYSTENDAKRSDKVWRATLGGKPELAYEEKDTAFDVDVGKTLDRKFIVISATSYGTADAHIIPADRPDLAPRLLVPRHAGVELFATSHHDGGFLVRTNDTAANFRLLQLPDDATDVTQATELIPPRDDTFLEDVDCFRNHIVLSERFAGLPRLAVFDSVTKHEEPIAMPESVYSVGLDANDRFDTDKLRFTFESLITPETTYEYDMNSKALVILKREESPGGYDPSKYEEKIVYAPARDGTKIPISMVWKKDRPVGPEPLYLDVYGAYGIPEWVDFDSDRISLLDRGVTYAIAHVRGGGELGSAWHQGGELMTKRNTFTDVIDATLYLQSQKITAPDKTAIYGASAGGLTVGAVLNERPDLFKVALLGVPFVDVMNTMLDPSLPLTTEEYFEWGNPNEKVAHDYMLSYSPYDNLAQKSYPATLVFSSYNDSQVMYWEPTKYVAKRRALNPTSNTPLLLSLTMTGGHDGPSGRTSEFDEETEHYAFVLWQLGITK